MDRLSRDVSAGGTGEVADHGGDFFRLTAPARAVAISPGPTQFTVMPWGDSSWASAFVSPTRPALPATTWARPAAPLWPVIPPMFTIAAPSLRLR